MDFRFTSDANGSSGIDEVVYRHCGPTCQHFATKEYGGGISLFLCFMCRSADLVFKRRIRFAKKERCLYIDIMFDIDEITPLSVPDKVKNVFGRILLEVPPLLEKYAFDGFDRERFIQDLTVWLEHRMAVT